MADTYLHTIKSVDFKIEGFGFLDVCSFGMTLQLGTIPTIVVGVSLAGGSKKASKQNDTTINQFSLGTVTGRFNKLVALAAENSRCHFRIRLTTTRMSDEKNGKQYLEVNNWVLVSAGLGSVSAETGFSCNCTIAHPVYELCMHGGFCTNFEESLQLEKKYEKVTDPVQAGRIVYEAVKNVKNKLRFKDSGKPIVPGEKTASAIMADVEGVFKNIPDLIDRHLEWRPELGGGKSGIPFKDILTKELLAATKMDMLETWLPVSSNSVWDIFVQCVCPEFDITVVPDYTKERLPVAPFYPWMSPSFSLNDTDINELLFPGVDPAPIYGLCSTPQMEQLNVVCTTFGGTAAQNLTKQATSLAYVPADGADVNGKFFTGALPEWLVSAIQIAPGLCKQPVKATTMGPPSGDAPSSGDSPFAKAANTLKMASMAYMFLKLYKKRLEAEMTCPLLISRNGEDPLLPGSVLSVRNDDGVLLQGMVVQVVHNLEMLSGTGSTGIRLAYCRPPEGYKVLKEVMDKNPMYS